MIDLTKFKENYKTKYLVDEYERLLIQLDDAKSMLGTDPEIDALAQADIASLETQMKELHDKMEYILKEDVEEEEKPRELERATTQVAEQEARVKVADEHVKALHLAQKQQEGELQGREEQARKLQGQLFQLKTNKEYSAMQREIESIKTDNSLLEEAVLKGFDAIEQAGKDRQLEQAHLAQGQERLRVERARIEEALALIHEQIAQLQERRNGIAPSVPREALSFYERVLAIREGLALVPLVQESCGGCHRRLPPQVLNEVYLKAKLVACEHCNRILYADDVQSQL